MYTAQYMIFSSICVAKVAPLLHLYSIDQNTPTQPKKLTYYTHYNITYTSHYTAHYILIWLISSSICVAKVALLVFIVLINPSKHTTITKHYDILYTTLQHYQHTITPHIKHTTRHTTYLFG